MNCGKWLCYVILLCLNLLTYGQATGNSTVEHRKNIYLNYGLQYDLLDGFDGMHLHPRWFYSPQLALGLNLELGDYGFSVGPTADYYFNTSKISPFVGVGLPVYLSSSFSSRSILALKTKLGLSIKRRFEVGLEINSVPNDWLYVTLKASVVGQFISPQKDNVKRSQLKDIRLHVGFQYNLPQRLFNRSLGEYDGRNSGAGVYFHPKWHRSEHLALGLNVVLAGVQPPNDTDVIYFLGILSASPTIDYYFTKFKIQPFIGFGTGFYHLFYGTSAFGVSPRLGLSFSKRFDLTLQYDRLLLANSSVFNTINNYYLAFKLGVGIGIINVVSLQEAKQKLIDLTPKHDVRLYFGFQYNMPQRWFTNITSADRNKNDGIALSLYPKWFYSNRLAFGLLLELASVESNLTESSIIFSLLPSVDYYLTQSLIKPFLGLATGLYYTDFAEQHKATSLGVKFKAGLSFNRTFELSCEYNRIFSNKIATQNFDNYYMGLKANISLGLVQSKKMKSKITE